METEQQLADRKLQEVLEQVHGRFINEEDFPDSGADGYKRLVERYISYKYEPLIEEYDEARYFTYKFDENLFKMCSSVRQRGRKIKGISLKPQ